MNSEHSFRKSLGSNQRSASFILFSLAFTDKSGRSAVESFIFRNIKDKFLPKNLDYKVTAWRKIALLRPNETTIWQFWVLDKKFIVIILPLLVQKFELCQNQPKVIVKTNWQLNNLPNFDLQVKPTFNCWTLYIRFETCKSLWLVNLNRIKSQNHHGCVRFSNWLWVRL